MRVLKIQKTKKYNVDVKNSTCSCGSGTGSGGHYKTEARKISVSIARIYTHPQQRQNYRTVA